MGVLQYCLLLSVLAVVVLIIVMAVDWYVVCKRSYKLGSKIPGPAGVPLLGNALSIIAHSQDFLSYLEQLRQVYGPVFQLTFGPYLVVVVADPDAIEVILSSNKTLSKAIMYNPIRLLMGTSVLTAKKHDWKRLRKLMNPTFSTQIIKSYVSSFYDNSCIMADKLQEMSGRDAFDILTYLRTCTLDIVAKTSLGLQQDTLNKNEAYHVLENFGLIVETFSYALYRPWYLATEIVKLLPAYKDFLKLIQPMRDFTDSLVRYKTMSRYCHADKNNGQEQTGFDKDSRKRLGFLDHMMSKMNKNPELLTAEELRDQVLTVILGGTDTTASVLACTLMLLGLHQDVQRSVVKEQEDIFGEDVHRPITASDLKKMVYLEQVINESMRLYPVGPLIGRNVDKEISVSGCTLPKGTTILIPVFFVQRDSDYFADPNKFDPERFCKENCLNIHSCSFIPFAFGRRMCIGKNYSYLVMKTILSVLLRRYKILEYGSRDDMECLELKSFLRLKNGYNIKLVSRNSGTD